jgi:5-formyltetrahydrofolate cyclo-ligase
MNLSRLHRYKSLLRNELRQSLKAIAGIRRRKRSDKIIQRLLTMSIFQNAANILIYVALPTEVETRQLILKTLKLGKRVFVPLLALRHKRIEIYRIKNWKKDLRKGTYGILEPKPRRNRKGRADEMDLVVSPGLGFDRRGARLGRGGGYFDRFLKRAKQAKKIGLAFREQIVKKIPTGPNDIRMDCVITD